MARPDVRDSREHQANRHRRPAGQPRRVPAGGGTLTEPTYRVLFASLSASVAQQVGTFTTAGAPAEPFPLALDLEAASAALEAFLG